MQIATGGRGHRAATRTAAGLAAALGLLAAARVARADGACIQAYEGTQIARKAGRLVEARADAAACSQPACPRAMITECEGWRAEIDRVLPSVLLAFERADGSDAIGAEVTLDGARVTPAGVPIPLDPGSHTARVTLAGFEPLEQNFLLQEGDQRRRISGKLVATKTSSPRLPAYVFAGTAVLGFGMAIGFGASATADYNELSARCSPLCTAEEAAGVRRKAIVADVFLGLGVASLATSAYFFFRPLPRVSALFAPTVGGAALRLAWTF